MRPIRRIVSCGPSATDWAGPNGGADPANRDYQDYQYQHPTHGNTANFFGTTNTTWVRLWADWSVFQPYPDVVLGQAYPDNGPDPKRVRAWRAQLALDRQINAIRTDGRRVMLTLWRCPPWANGTQWHADRRDAGFVWDDIDFHPEDRLRREVYQQWKDSNPGNKELRTHDLCKSRRQLEYRWPDDLDADSPWATWFRFMYERYRPGVKGHDRCVNVLEICNEPNSQMWPKQGVNTSDVWASADPNYGCAVSQIMATAAFISSWYDYDMMLAGPSTSDEPNDRGYPRMWTPWSVFQDQVLASNASSGWNPHSKFVWTHHNYVDIEENRTTTANNQAYAARRNLRGKWTGYTEGQGPMLFVNEGGLFMARAQEQRPSDPEGLQAERLTTFGNILNSSTDAVAPSIGMMSNYLFYSTPPDVASGDVGLRRSIVAPYNGNARPAQTAWSNINPVDGMTNEWMWWINLGGNTNYDPSAIARSTTHREVFMIDAANGNLMHKWEAGAGFTPTWDNLGGYCTAAPSAYARDGNRMDVAVRGWDNGVYLKYFENSFGWYGGWDYWGYPTPGGVQAGINGAPSIYSWNAGHRDVYVRAFDNQIYQRWESNGYLSGWGSLGAPPGGATSAPTVIAWVSGRVDLFVRGGDNCTWYRGYQGSWGPWTSIGGECRSAPRVCSFRPGRLDVFVLGPGDAPWRRCFEGRTDGSGFLVEGRWGAWERVRDQWGTAATGGFASAPAPDAALRSDNARIDMFIRAADGSVRMNWWGH